MINSLIKVLLFVLIPCAVFAQVLPDTLKSKSQDSTEVDAVNGYDVNGDTCFEKDSMLCHKMLYREVGLLKWEYKLDYEKVDVDKLYPYLKANPESRGNYWASRVTWFLGVGSLLYTAVACPLFLATGSKAIGISWGVSFAAGLALGITSVTELHIAIDDYR